MKLIPTRTQWQKWSLPGKAGYIGLLLALIGLLPALSWSSLLLENVRNKFTEVELPNITINPVPMSLASDTTNTLSFAAIRTQNAYRLTIRNKANVLLTDIQLCLQFPEPILEIQVVQVPFGCEAKADERFDERPLEVLGEAPESLALENCGGEEKTGLWKLNLQGLPADGSAEFKIVTIAGNGIYDDIAKEVQRVALTNKLTWVLWGYLREAGQSKRQRNIIVPLTYETNRSVRALTGYSSLLTEGDYTKIRQGRGVRVPGLFSLRGYAYARCNEDKWLFSAPFRLERTNSISMLVGLVSWRGLGPLTPGVRIHDYEKGTEIRITTANE